MKKIDSNLVFLRPQNPSNVCPNTIDLSDLIEKSPCTRNFIEDNHTKFGLLKQGIQALEENGDLVDKAFPYFCEAKMTVSEVKCFKSYDIRGEIGVSIDEDISYRVGRAVAQHFEAKTIVLGYDARKTSPLFAAAVSKGVRDAGSNVINIGLAGTEEMYWAVTEFDACAGIEVTASHNPIN